MISSSRRRVVITGMGVISPLGNQRDDVWKALLAGQNGISRLEQIPPDHLPSPFAAEAKQFTGHINDFGTLPGDLKKKIRKGLNVMCREIQMGVAAAQRALGDAQLQVGQYDPDRTGVVYGADYMMTMPDEFVEGVRSCLGEDHNFEFSRWAQEGLPKVTPLWLLKYLPNMPASHIAIYNDMRGPNNSITVREASSNLAIGEACSTIARGSADVIVAGATGTRVHPMRTLHVVLQEELAHHDDPACLARPFDLNRNGMVLGEGAGAIVLEELEFAKARGANILAEVIGHASSSVLERDGTPRCGRAVANVIRQTLREAELEPADIGHIHAHGLGTQKADREESQGIAEFFSDCGRDVPVTAAKSYFGNLGAGSGLVELITSVMALEHNHLFPVLNYQAPDPACPISVAAGSATSPGDSALNLNFTPQGQASAVLIRRYE